MGIYIQEAKKGMQFVLTEKGYNKTPDSMKHERKIGEPIKGYEFGVPVSWIQKGYVVEITRGGLDD